MVRTVISSAVKAENSKYEEAVKTLNTLQTNAQTLDKIRQERDKYANLNIPKMLRFAERVGIKEADMDRLNVIHVSGTKGKGSTCAFCESVLRHHGYKTGFYSSPHLVEVRERLNVNGAPLERDKFASYFWDVYNKLDQSKTDHDGAMPNYFGFLTIMAMHVFLQEKVDVAIVEVGIGGQYDSTNMIRRPLVCGVSSLGLDHTSILGKTIDKIAWHKAGIFKPGVPAFTAPQAPEAIEVLQQRSVERQAPLSVCPSLTDYSGFIPKLGIKGNVQALNASLALQLCHTWMDRYKQQEDGTTIDEVAEFPPEGKVQCNGTGTVRTAEPFCLTKQDQQGLEKCQWLGRNQIIRTADLNFFLDGAHTKESMQQCTEWFKSETGAGHRSDVYRVLIFNTTGDRSISPLVDSLQSCPFNAVLFCPNIAFEEAITADQTKVTSTKESQMERCLYNQHVWEQQLNGEQHTDDAYVGRINGSSHGDNSDHVRQIDQSALSDSVGNDAKHAELHTLPSISHCIDWIRTNRSKGCKDPKTVHLNGIGKVSDTVTVSDSDTANGTRTSANGVIENGVNSYAHKESEDKPGIVKGASDQQEVHVLITGSLYLVGGALRVIWDL